jgi:hypothetical protein
MLIKRRLIYADSGDSEKLKSWATTTLHVLQHHLDTAKSLDK